MATWIYNTNSDRHRGVWHVVEGELRIKTIPHKVRDEYEYEIFKYHSKKCDFYYSQKPGREFYDEINRTFRKPVCSCSLRTTQQSVLMGTCHIVNIVPEHNIITGQQVLCHQAVIHSGSVHSDASLYTKKRTPGTTLTFVARIEPPHLFYGDLPPGPVCSRCIAKVNEN